MDACTFTLNSLVLPSQIKACFDLIPFNSTIRDLTLAEMNKLVDLYSYSDIVNGTGSGNPYNINVDLKAELAALQTQTFTNDFFFHSKLNEIFSRLGDAHTLYNPPLGYSTFVKCPPYKPKITNNGGVLNITANGEYVCYTGGANKTHNGFQIVSINGTNTRDYILNLGKRLGIVKDDGVRFNQGFQIFFGNRVDTLGLPTSNTEEWTFSDGQTENHSFFYIVTANTVSVADIIARNRATRPPAKKREVRQTEKEREREEKFQKEKEKKYFHMEYQKIQGEFINSQNNFVKRAASIVVVNISLESSVSWGILTTSTSLSVPYLRVRSFSSTANTSVAFSNWVNSFFSVVNQFVANYTASNSSRVVVDVRSNGGGFVCMSRWLTARLVSAWYPNQTKITKDTPFEIPINARSGSSLSKSLIQSTALGYFGNINPYTGNLITDSSCYANNALFYSSRPNGATSPLAGFNFLDCSDYFLTSYPLSSVQPEFRILTDGLCGSACSHFISKLWINGKARYIGIGGIPNLPLETSSFCGGNVFDWTFLVTYFNSTRISGGPNNLPTSAFTRFNFNMAYMNSTSIPREFLRFPSDFVISDWNAFNDAAVFSSSLPTFYETALNTNFNTSLNSETPIQYNSSYPCYANPTPSPSNSPSNGPTTSPSNSPSSGPTTSPSNAPSTNPSNSPSNKPTNSPTQSSSSTLTLSIILLISFVFFICI